MSMKARMILMTVCLALFSMIAYADETVTVTATNADISEDLDLKTVATLFGQAKDLEQFEQMLNNPDSAFSNLDLNGDGNVDYLRVIETADQNTHLVVIQAVLAKDIYQDVASIIVEKDSASESVTVQVIGDEYVYGADYIIEPVYIYRPIIYDWFWGPSWVCWHSPFYWDYWPGWWHPYHCIAHHLYWEHIYWHHHYYPICTYRTGHHHHPHYAPMRERVSRSDYATRHPERSFATRNASTRYTNARDIDRSRQAAIRTNSRASASGAAATRVSSRSVNNASRTFGSTNVRTNDRITAATQNRTSVATRVDNSSARTAATRNTAVAGTATRSRTNTTATQVRTSTSAQRVSNVSTATRSSAPSVSRPSTSSAVRSSSSPAVRSSSSSAVRSSSSSSMRSSSPMPSSAGSMRSSGGASSASRSSGGSTRR